MEKKIAKWRTVSGMKGVARDQLVSISSITSTREHQTEKVEGIFKAKELAFHTTDVRLEKSSQRNFVYVGSEGERVVIEKKMPCGSLGTCLCLLVLLKTSLVF